MHLKSILASTVVVAAGTLFATPTVIHQYNFNGGTVTDLVGAANGTLLNGATITGGKLTLDGFDDYAEFATYLVPTAGPFSVSFDAQAILENNGQYKEIISQEGGHFYVGYDPSHIIRLSDTYLNTGVAYPSDGAMHSFIFTTDGSGTRLYIDGALEFSGAAQISSSAVGTFTRLGRQFDGHAEYFHGSMDNVAIYEGSFSADDVARLNAVPDSTGTAALIVLSAGALLAARRRFSHPARRSA